MFGASLASLASILLAIIDVYPTDDFEALMNTAQPGDEVVLHEGVYVTPGYFEVIFNGTQANPIWVHPAEGDNVVFQGITTQNIIHVGGSYFTFEGFELQTSGGHGLVLRSCSNATFAGLKIHDVDAAGIIAAESGQTYADITVRDTEIYNTGLNGPGEGIMLGCGSGCSVDGALVEFNYIHDNAGGTPGTVDGVQIRGGSSNVRVLHNVFHDVGGPAVLVQGGSGGGAAHRIEGNAAWAIDDNVLQVDGDATIANNILTDFDADGIRIAAGDSTGAVQVVNNTIWNPSSTCMRVSAWPGGDQGRIANNALYCEGGNAALVTPTLPDGTSFSNVVLGSATGLSGTSAGGGAIDFANSAAGNYYPSISEALDDAATAALLPERDFNCQLRSTPSDVGALEGIEDTNPGWFLSESFKTCPEPSGGDGDGDGDSSTDTTSTGDGDADTSTDGGDGDTSTETTTVGGDGDGDSSTATTDGGDGDSGTETTDGGDGDTSTESTTDGGDGDSETATEGGDGDEEGTTTATEDTGGADETNGDETDAEAGGDGNTNLNVNCDCKANNESPATAALLLFAALLPIRRRRNGAV